MDHKDVPYLVYEATQARNERTIKRLIIVIIMTIFLLALTNIFWVYEWSQFEYVGEESVDLSTDGGGDANYIGNNGDINNGKDTSSAAPSNAEEKR